MTEPRPHALIGRILAQLRQAQGQPTQLLHLGTEHSRHSALTRLREHYGHAIVCTNRGKGLYLLREDA
jgi:hypothetical protein